MPHDAVHRDGADRVVELELRSTKNTDSMTSDAGDQADDRRRPRGDEGARRGDRDEAGEHAVGHHARVGLAGALRDPQHGHDRAERTGDRGVRGDDGELHVGGGEGRCGVEAEPAEQQDERAEHRHRDVVAGDRLAACRRCRTCRCGDRARWRRRGRRRRRRRARRRNRRSRRSRRRGSSCPRSWRASRRPRSTPRTAGSRWRRRRGPRPRSCSTSTARPSRRSGSWRWCP